MASKDEKNKIKIIQAVLDFHTKDLISTSTIQMELKKTIPSVLQGPVPRTSSYRWCLLHCLQDEQMSASRRRDDQMNTKRHTVATHAKSSRGLRTCGDGRRVRGVELGAAGLASLEYIGPSTTGLIF